MFDLFRFVMLRAAVPAEPHEILSTSSLDSDLQRQLERERERPSPGAPMEHTANLFLEGEGAVSSANPLAFGAAYDALSASLRIAIPTNRNGLLTEITNASGLDAVDLVEEQGFRDDRQRLADTLIAAKLGTPRIDLPLDSIARDLRLVALIQRAADGDARLDTADGIQAALDANIALPDKLLPIDQPLAAPGHEGGERPPAERERPVDDGARRREQALREYRELTEAHDYLSSLPAQHVLDTGAASATAAGLTGEGRAERPAAHERGEPGDAIFREIRELRDAVLSRRIVAEGSAGSIVAAGLSVSSARILQGTTLRIRPEVLTEAPQAVHAGLRAAHVDLAATSLSDAVDRINARRRELAPLALDDLIGASAVAGGSNVSLVGGQFVPTSQVPDLVTRGEGREHA